MIKRKILPILEKELSSDKIIVLTGMRRVGKTTLVRHLYDRLEGVKKLYLDLENPLNQSYFTHIDFDKIRLDLERLTLGKGRKSYIFLDEIQNIKNLPSIVKYLHDHFKIKFILTGSASFYLKNLFSESLAGRKRIFELYPLDFEEFLMFKAPNLKKMTPRNPIDKHYYLLLEKYIAEYLIYGGFPSVVLKETADEKLAEIDDILTSYFQKEVRLLSDFRKLDIVRSLIILLARRVGSKLDISKISSELGVSRVTIQEYLDFFAGTYFLKTIRPYSKNVDISFRGQVKAYFADTGLLTKIGSISQSQILENAVFNLIKDYGLIYYYQSKTGSEVDFIVKKNNHREAYEVKSYAHQSDLNKLKKIAAKLKIQKFYLVSQSFSPLKNVIFLFQL